MKTNVSPAARAQDEANKAIKALNKARRDAGTGNAMVNAVELHKLRRAAYKAVMHAETIKTAMCV